MDATTSRRSRGTHRSRLAAAIRWPVRAMRRNLGLQLLALYLLFVGPALAAILTFDAIAGARLQDDVRAADLALARSIALESDASLGNALGTVQRLAATPSAQSLAPAALAPQFAAVKLARNDVDLVYLLDARGIMLYHYPEGPGSTVGQGFAFRGYYRDALTATAPFMSGARISPTTGHAVATAVMPIRDASGAFLGLIGTNIALERLSTTLGRIADDPRTGLRVSIVDAIGQVVADSDEDRLLADANAELSTEIEAVFAGRSGSREATDGESRAWLRSYAPIASSRWGVIVQRPADVAFASPSLFHAGLLLGSAVFAAGGLFFWLMLSRRVIGPLGRLAAFTRSIGEPTAPGASRDRMDLPSGRPDQVGHLARTLEGMKRQVERRFEELTTLLDTSGAVVSTLDEPRILDTILAAVERLLPVHGCAVVALDERAGVFRIRASRGLSPGYAHDLRIRPTEPLSPTMRAIRSRRPIQIDDIEHEPVYPPGLRERARAEGYQSLLAVPLITQHTPPLALLVYSRSAHHLTPEDVALLSSLGNHAAMAIENAALFALTDEKLREQTRVLEALVESIGDGLILEGPDGRVVYANRRVGELAGVPFEELHDHSGASLRARLGPETEGDEVTVHQGARPADIRIQSFDVTDAQGELIGRGQLWLDVTRDRELDRMKTALVSAVSHELRTPLAAIKGNISSLLAEDVVWDAAAQREFLQVALDEADRLSQLVTNLLDLSRIEAGTLVVRREPLALEQLTDRAAAFAEPGRVVIDVPPDLPAVLVDPARIEVVLRNLIDNAARHGSAHSPIRLSALREDGHLLVRVANSSRPIAAGDRDRLFEPFFQVRDGLSQPSGGVGLGLSIAKGFVEAHDGRIWLETTGDEVVFTFSLPLASP